MVFSQWFVYYVYGPCHMKKKMSEGKCCQRRPRQDCVSAQSDERFHCPLAESLDITKFINRAQRPKGYLAHAQDDLNLHISHIFEDTFSLDDL